MKENFTVNGKIKVQKTEYNHSRKEINIVPLKCTPNVPSDLKMQF